MLKKSIIFATLAATTPIAASAQDIGADATFGSIELEANFAEDPTSVEVTSGGEIDVSETIDGCVGFISDEPDVRLTFTASTSPDAFPLFISAVSDGDTTLVVNAPDGRYYCNDDGNDGGENGTNPSIVFGPAQSGAYEIWLGSFEEGEYLPAEVLISELSGQ